MKLPTKGRTSALLAIACLARVDAFQPAGIGSRLRLHPQHQQAINHGTTTITTTELQSTTTLTTSTATTSQRNTDNSRGYNPQSSTYNYKFISDNAYERAADLIAVFSNQLILPLFLSLLREGKPTDWCEFWNRSHDDGSTNAQRVAQALEELGPTYVKFGQALASRPDIVPPALAHELEMLQDSMKPFHSSEAEAILRREWRGSSDDVPKLSAMPVAAASIGQVYKAELPELGTVAIKIQRPGIRAMVEQDAKVLRGVAEFLESLKLSSDRRLIQTDLVNAVDEFMTRIVEELDYRNEANNAQLFGEMYGMQQTSLPEEFRVVVPQIYTDYCTQNILVMQWMDGETLTQSAMTTPTDRAEFLDVVQQGIRCTLRQLLVDGVFHADPHAGNLLKVRQDDGGVRLGYLDFGIVARIDAQVRDALVCAVTQLVFHKDYRAVADLMGELQLLPPRVMQDQRKELYEAMERTLTAALHYPTSTGNEEMNVPVLLFDQLLEAMVRMIPQFQFQLPPYFINNARGLSTLEGIARTLDPEFNVLQIMYPYALSVMLENPSGSEIVDRSLQQLIRNPTTGRLSRRRIRKIVRDSAALTGYTQRQVLKDVLRTSKGRKLARSMLMEEMKTRVTFGCGGNKEHVKTATQRRKRGGSRRKTSSTSTQSSKFLQL